MTFTQTCTITARRDVVWDFLLQAENVARCLPGVEALKQLDQDNYEGTLRVKSWSHFPGLTGDDARGSSRP